MKVICINDRNHIGGKSLFVTKGRWYDVTHEGAATHMFYIKSDGGTYPAVERKNFMTLEEYRNSKLEQIGI